MSITKYEQFENYYLNKENIDLSNSENIFNQSCIRGDLQLAIFMWNVSDKNIKINLSWLIKKVCELNHLHICKWLWENMNKSIIYDNVENLFKYACTKSNFDIAIWLWNLTNNTMNINNHLSNSIYNRITFSLVYMDNCNDTDIDLFRFLSGISNKRTDDINFKRIYRYKSIDSINYYTRHFYYKPPNGPGYLTAVE